MEKNKVEKIVNLAYREIIFKCDYHLIKGNIPIKTVCHTPMSEIPKIITEYVNEYKCGSSFVFATYLMNILNSYNIDNHMIVTIKDNGLMASVLYQMDNEYFIASPTEDIEFFTENKINKEKRIEYYIDDTATFKNKEDIHNHANYKMEEFSKKYGGVWYVGSMKKEDNDTLNDQMNLVRERCIAPNEKVNYQIK